MSLYENEDELGDGGGMEDVVDVEYQIRGGDRAKPKLLDWLKKIVDNPDTQQDVQLTLCQLVQKGGEKVVKDFLHALDKDPEGTIDEVIEAAENDILTGRFVNTIAYTLRAEGASGTRMNFTLTKPVRTGTGEQFHRGHFANLEGIVGQQMEHTQVLVEKVIEQSDTKTTATAEANGLLMAIIRDLRKRVAELESREMIMKQNAERLLDGNLRREMMFDEYKKDQERKDKWADGFKRMGPPLLAAVVSGDPKAAMLALAASAGSEDGPPPGLAAMLPGMASGAPSEADLIDAFMEDVVKVDNLQNLADSCSEVQMGILMQLYSNAMARKEARSQAETAARARAEEDAAKEREAEEPAFGLAGGPTGKKKGGGGNGAAKKPGYYGPK